MRWALLLVAALGGACTTPLTAMVHPVTGETQMCTSHLPPALADLEIERCVARLKKTGFVKAEELTGEHRKGLEAVEEQRRAARAAAARGEGSDNAPQPADEAAGERIWRRVTLVLDEQTVVLDGGQPLRYLGIRRLEASQIPTAAGRLAEAMAFNRQLVEGQTVRLEFDLRLHDPEGNLWGYVYLLDGRLVNAILVERGYAQADPYQPQLKHFEMFRRLEQEARAERRGLWGWR